MPLDLVGVTQIGEMLGVTPQRADQLSHEPGFPKPAVDRPQRRLWRRAAVQRWDERRPRRRTQEELVDEIAALLAERPHLTALQIAEAVGAKDRPPRRVLDALDSKRFRSRTGKAAKKLGRHPSAVLWENAKGGRRAA